MTVGIMTKMSRENCIIFLSSNPQSYPQQSQRYPPQSSPQKNFPPSNFPSQSAPKKSYTQPPPPPDPPSRPPSAYSQYRPPNPPPIRGHGSFSRESFQRGRGSFGPRGRGYIPNDTRGRGNFRSRGNFRGGHPRDFHSGNHFNINLNGTNSMIAFQSLILHKP